MLLIKAYFQSKEKIRKKKKGLSPSKQQVL